MNQAVIYGSGKYFTKLQNIELHVSFGADTVIKVESFDGDSLAVVRATVRGSEGWGKLAGDTLEALGQFYVRQYDDIPSEEMFDAWHEATAIVWKRALVRRDIG